MNFGHRKFLIYCPTSCSLPELSQSNWQGINIDSLGSLQNFNSKDVQVGLFYIDQELSNDVLEELICSCPKINWIAIASKATIKSPQVKQRISCWFYDYHTLPIDEERLLFSLGRAYGMSNLNTGNNKNNWIHKMVGNSKEMQQLYLTIEKLSDSNAPVLISGESGTGKELVAQAIHAESSYSKGSIIELNCGAIPRDLIQSALFGHEKGAFTGAFERVIGCVEAANNGTLFLDEIGDLPLDLQANLLRVLQEGAIQRIGSHERVPVNVRIIAATHIDLEQAILEKRFREDLYYRLNVVPVNVPPLRHRDSDIELLAQHFLELFRKEAPLKITGFSYSALAAITIHDWPGNVRELINRVRRAVIMSEDSIIRAKDLGLSEPVSFRKKTTNLEDVRAKAERETIDRVLNMSNSNISNAAELLGISRRTLYRLIEKHCFVLH